MPVLIKNSISLCRSPLAPQIQPTTLSRVRTILRWAALTIALVIVAFWVLDGMNRGWTKTSVPHKEKDPVTEIEVDRFEDKFVPGVDFLAAGLIVAGVVGVSSFFFRKN